MRKAEPLLSRIRRLTLPEDRGHGTPCWIWQGYTHPNGYGFWGGAKGRSKLAHRAAWEELRGPIPEGLSIDHLCRNRACCNPDHLEPVSSATNIRRGDLTKMTVDEVVLIRARYAAGERICDIHRDYPKCSVVNINHIVHRRRWLVGTEAA